MDDTRTPTSAAQRLARAVIGLTLTGSFVAPSPAWAARVATQPEGGDPESQERIRALYAEARAAYDAGSYRSAIRSFEETYALSGDANLLYNISVCYDRLGEFDKAIEYLDKFAKVAPASEQEAISRKRRSLETRHERETAEREAQARESAPAPAPEPTPQPAPEQQPVAAPVVDDRSDADKGLLVGGAVALGLGVVGLGTGIGFGVTSLGRRDDADCEEVDGSRICTSGGESDAEDSRRFGLAADVSLGLGVAFAAVGVALLTVWGVRRKRRNNTAMSAFASPTTAGLVWRARF